MNHLIEHDNHTIEITTEHPASSYGIPVLVVDGEVVMQVPLTKEEREQMKRLIHKVRTYKKRDGRNTRNAFLREQLQTTAKVTKVSIPVPTIQTVEEPRKPVPAKPILTVPTIQKAEEPQKPVPAKPFGAKVNIFRPKCGPATNTIEEMVENKAKDYRDKRAIGLLDAETIARLDKIGFDWDGSANG